MIQIYYSAENLADAEKIAEHLVTNHLVACAQIIERISSYFIWEGKMQKAKEALVILKTLDKNFEKIESEIKKLSSSQVPEIIECRITRGHKPYLEWIEANCN